MDFNTVCKLLYDNIIEIYENSDFNTVPSVYDNNIEKIKRDYLIRRETERRRREFQKNKIKDEKEKIRRSNFSKALNSLSS